MKSKRDIEKREDRITYLANKKIDKIEQKIGRKVEKKEIIDVFEDAEKYVKAKDKAKRQKQKQRKKLRNKIIAILGALGITIGGGHALLTSGETQDTNIKVEENDTKDDSNLKFRDEMKVNVAEEYAINSMLIDEILENYNSKLNDENKIDKTDLRNNITK